MAFLWSCIVSGSSGGRRPRIRASRPNDVTQLVKIDQQCFPGGFWSKAGIEEEVLGPESRGVMLVAEAEEEEGDLIGCGCLRQILDEGTITYLAVLPESRRLGVAKALIQNLLDAAVSRGLSFVGLEVSVDNLAAIELYKRHGFEEVGYRKNYYDFGKDAVTMKYNLSPKQQQ